ncbi:ABC transporter ATP-binding protein [Novipirellula artificiosorum]|uniref:Daunorubicin/doxorubicin resistance ATP-binding protein DrrA n=1 Tax=Novipirellula artificiosorum TaxID=2528016 RepID=A0A5C6DXI0_9BACT|nr:ATP-binding cassette domain-containing protein [Novipirellula artificiosorum]TWU42143.1 Daunorubicin/doxorubicin resistance ATP-binding protein DrrA [Novipirellula artificiosorum]
MSSNLKQPVPETEDHVQASEPVCVASGLRHTYVDHEALKGVDLKTHAGEIVTLLGPNGSGKTTLFRLLSTLMPIQHGTVRIAGYDSYTNPLAVRRQLGIVFQAPSLDNKLTVDENIACQGALYGMTGKVLERRRDELLEQLKITNRRKDYCETLSGGLKRRVELVKGMLHEPKLLLLDEPSTGLDPGARLDLWAAVREMADEGTSVLLTTHLLEEADKADRVVILHNGQQVEEGTPSQLRSKLGKGVVTIEAEDVAAAERVLRNELGLDPQRLHHQLRLQSDTPAELVPLISDRLGHLLQAITIGRPSLEDVFIAKTGHKFH